MVLVTCVSLNEEEGVWLGKERIRLPLFSVDPVCGTKHQCGSFPDPQLHKMDGAVLDWMCFWKCCLVLF